jgi:phosphopantetheine--protein transferase-like protein
VRIVGLGVGAVETNRFRAAERRFGARLHARLFTDRERAYGGLRRRGTESLAARLAAKLAARGALGCPGLPLRDLEVVRERGRAPTLAFHAGAARAARECGVARTSLSLTHDARWCLAHVVLEGGP